MYSLLLKAIKSKFSTLWLFITTSKHNRKVLSYSFSFNIYLNLQNRLTYANWNSCISIEMPLESFINFQVIWNTSINHYNQCSPHSSLIWNKTQLALSVRQQYPKQTSIFTKLVVQIMPIAGKNMPKKKQRSQNQRRKKLENAENLNHNKKHRLKKKSSSFSVIYAVTSRLWLNLIHTSKHAAIVL